MGSVSVSQTAADNNSSSNGLINVKRDKSPCGEDRGSKIRGPGFVESSSVTEQGRSIHVGKSNIRSLSMMAADSGYASGEIRDVSGSGSGRRSTAGDKGHHRRLLPQQPGTQGDKAGSKLRVPALVPRNSPKLKTSSLGKDLETRLAAARVGKIPGRGSPQGSSSGRGSPQGGSSGIKGKTTEEKSSSGGLRVSPKLAAMARRSESPRESKSGGKIASSCRCHEEPEVDSDDYCIPNPPCLCPLSEDCLRRLESTSSGTLNRGSLTEYQSDSIEICDLGEDRISFCGSDSPENDVEDSAEQSSLPATTRTQGSAPLRFEHDSGNETGLEDSQLTSSGYVDISGLVGTTLRSGWKDSVHPKGMEDSLEVYSAPSDDMGLASSVEGDLDGPQKGVLDDTIKVNSYSWSVTVCECFARLGTVESVLKDKIWSVSGDRLSYIGI